MVRDWTTALEDSLQGQPCEKPKRSGHKRQLRTSTSADVVPSARPLISTTFPLELAPLIAIPVSPFASRSARSASDMFILGGAPELLRRALSDLFPSKRSCCQVPLMSPLEACRGPRACARKRYTDTSRPGHIQEQKQSVFKESGRRLVRTRAAVQGQDGGAHMGSFRRGWLSCCGRDLLSPSGCSCVRARREQPWCTKIVVGGRWWEGEEG